MALVSKISTIPKKRWRNGYSKWVVSWPNITQIYVFSLLISPQSSFFKVYETFLFKKDAAMTGALTGISCEEADMEPVTWRTYVNHELLIRNGKSPVGKTLKFC